jgi:hypothetical protein
MFTDDAERALQSFSPIRFLFVVSSEVETSLNIS